MRFVLLLLAFGCILAAASLAYGMWLSRARKEELARLKSFLAIELRDAPLRAAAADGATSWLPQPLQRKLRQAGWTPRRNLVLVALAGCLLAVLLVAATFGLLAGLTSAAAILGVAFAGLEYRIQTQRRELSDAMLGFLERVRQLITVGDSLSTALERSVSNSPAVVVRALQPAVRRIRNGSGVAESLERCAQEVEVYELDLFATAVRTNMRFGGSMTQILRSMIENIRKRTAVERELRADTTQIRASAWVLALLPVLVAALVMFTNRDYGRWFLDTESGHRMIGYALVSQLIGAVLMRMIVRVRY